MKKLSFLPLLIFLLVHIQCGGGGDRTYSGTTPVSIKITEVTEGIGSGADQLSGAVKTVDLASAVADVEGSGRQLSVCRFTITGPGMADMVRDVDVTGKNSIIETFNIPSGVNRKILIELFVENDDKAIYQSSREGIILEDKPLALEMNLEPTADYSLPPSFEGVLSVSNAESRSVELSWKPAVDNITPHDRIQYLVYLSTESIIGREGEFVNIYSLGKGSVLEGDALMSYEYDGDELLLISYEYEGALPSQGTTVTGLLATGRLQTGTPYYFIVKAQDEWGHEEGNVTESEEVVVYMLDVDVQGSGTVTSEPAGINCGAKCSEDYLSGTEVTLTAQADGGAAFESWTGNDQCGVAEVCNVIPDEDTPTLTAKFCQTGRYYLDMDGDGYGDAASVLDVCIKPDNHVENGDDCDDSDDTINPVATELCGNNIDEDCDGAIEAVCPPCNEGETRTCGTDAGQCMFGTQECINGVFSEECMGEIGPTAELCDGLDNDCNGLIDDGIGDIPRICGTGACSSTGKLQCLDGQIVDTCVPGEPTAEICDGIDNDCNGELDDGIVEEPTTCGEGACGSTGVLRCVFGLIEDTCVPAEPTAEICDGIDNDCNGLIDDNPTDAGGACSTGIGECLTNGIEQCVGGILECDAVPGTPGAEVCEGTLDENCDGTVDDGCACINGETRPTTCGQGVCAKNTGQETCTNGKWGGDTCDPFAGAGAEVCEGTLDEDCDGTVDDGCACTNGETRPTTCGQGVCANNTGQETCTNGKWGGDTCDPFAGAGAEVCEGTLDEDCDGTVDDGCACTNGETRPTTCGQGVCANNTGQETCTNGKWGGDTCDPFAGALPEECDDLDNDCDGPVDEDGVCDDNEPPSFSGMNSPTLNCNASPVEIDVSWPAATDNVTPKNKIEYMVCWDANPLFYGQPNPAECVFLTGKTTYSIDTMDGQNLVEGQTVHIGVTPYDEAGNGAFFTGTKQITVDCQFTLSVNKSPVASLVTSDPAGINCGNFCSNDFQSGEEVKLTFQPQGGNYFSSYSISPDPVIIVDEQLSPQFGGYVSIIMNHDLNVTANFIIP